MIIMPSTQIRLSYQKKKTDQMEMEMEMETCKIVMEIVILKYLVCRNGCGGSSPEMIRNARSISDQPNCSCHPIPAGTSQLLPSVSTPHPASASSTLLLLLTGFLHFNTRNYACFTFVCGGSYCSQ